MKRRVLMLALFLVLGAIVNVAVAAWAALHLEQQFHADQASIYTYGGDSETVSSDGAQRTMLESLGLIVPKDDSLFTYVVEHADYGSAACDTRVYVLQPRLRPGSRPPPPISWGGVPVVAQRLSAGWPFAALRAHRLFDSGNATYFATSTKQLSGGMEIGATTGPGVGLLVPTAAIWPGFAINTVFYAAVLWLLFAAPFALRKRLRIKRGLCPKCAYDLRGCKGAEKCPECGQLLKPSQLVHYREVG